MSLGIDCAFLGASPRAAGISYYNHMPAVRVQRHTSPEVWRDYQKVTIERNPWDCKVSSYFWRCQGKSPPPLSRTSSSTRGLGAQQAPELPRAKGAFRPSNTSYRNFYNERTREMIAKRYEREIAAFGYTF